ncbi:MAG: putative metal-binding motif-containing protein, partial [Pseudomonadota bacterium]
MPGKAALSCCVLAALAAAPAAVSAHSAGIAASGCEGCHSGGQTPTVTLTASPTAPAVGEQVTLTVTVTQTNGPVAGFFLTSDAGVGTFKAIQAGTTVSAGGVMHTMPHTGSNGITTFQGAWSASQATGVRFMAYALSANGDGTSRGDGGGAAILAMTAGCPGTDYYIDQDGDGYGTSDPAFVVERACAQPDGYAAVAGDCDDVEPSIHPGAVEVCNGKDDNCNGQIDEGLPQQFFCRDHDGDGHGVAGEGQEASCRPMPGYGDCGGDCDDSNPAAYVQFTCAVG